MAKSSQAPLEMSFSWRKVHAIPRQLHRPSFGASCEQLGPLSCPQHLLSLWGESSSLGSGLSKLCQLQHKEDGGWKPKRRDKKGLRLETERSGETMVRIVPTPVSTAVQQTTVEIKQL